MTGKAPLDFDGTLEKLSSEDFMECKQAWMVVLEHSTEFHEGLDEEQLRRLRNLYVSQKHPDLARLAKKAKIAMGRAAVGLPGQSGRRRPRRTKNRRRRTPSSSPGATQPDRPLAEWLWEPFHGPSVVLGVTAPDYRRRDEPALLWLARRLSFDKYGRTEFPSVALDNPDIERLLFATRYHAFCLVGRLGLFGKKALACLSPDDLRFGFELHHRPQDVKPGELHPKYHSIVERGENPRRKTFHRTSEKTGCLTDFAVVQRYMVELGAHQKIPVVIIAGASSLGTLAATQWAAYHLFQSTAGEKPIGAPVNIAPNSRMEALLSVKAKVTTSTWEHPEMKLLQLYADNSSWSAETRKWHIPPVKVITVVRKNNEAVQILFDGQPSPLEPGKQAFRLMVVMAEQQLNYGRLDIAALAANDWIWGGPGHNVEHVRRRLSELRTRYLRDALNIRGTLELRARVELRET